MKIAGIVEVSNILALFAEIVVLIDSEAILGVLFKILEVEFSRELGVVTVNISFIIMIFKTCAVSVASLSKVSPDIILKFRFNESDFTISAEMASSIEEVSAAVLSGSLSGSLGEVLILGEGKGGSDN